jgi:hypothetical protein
MDGAMTDTQANRRAKKHRQPQPLRRFPAAMNFGITRAMNDAVHRLSLPGSPFSQSDVGRMALHEFLFARDPIYRQAVTDEAPHETA